MRHGVRRSFLTVFAQSLSSVTNFLVAFLAFSAGTLTQFGQFAIGFNLCQLVITVSMGSTATVVLIRGAGDGGDGQTEVHEGSGLAGVLASAVVGALFAVVAVFSAGDLREALLISAVGAPFLTAQYHYRSIRFAKGDPIGAAVADGIWLAILVGAAVFDQAGVLDLSSNDYLAAWVIGAAVSAAPLTGALVRGRRQLRRFWSIAGPQSVRLAAESGLARSIFVVSLVATEWLVGSEASGLLAAGVLVFSPMTVVHTSALAYAVPSAIERAGIHVVKPVYVAAVSLATAGITVAWGAVLLLADHLGWGPGPFALDKEGVTGIIFFGTAARFVGLGAWRGPLTALRIADASRESLRARATATTVEWALPLVGLLVADLEGGIIGLAASTWFGAAVSWQSYRSLDPEAAR